MNSIEIEEWLERHNINNFLIDEKLQVTVHGNVNLHSKLNEKKLPIKFKLVDGYFDISDNQLISLEGSPEVVTRDFNCSKNNLESLFDGPKEVGDFDCSYNKLKNLSYAPKDVKGYFNCSNNDITSLKGSPRTIKGYFNCSHNKISSLKGGPKYIELYFDCSFNLLDKLTGGPNSVGRDYICNGNTLFDLDGVADEIGWDLLTEVRMNHVDCVFTEETGVYKYKGSEAVSHIYKPLVALTNVDDISRWLVKHEIKEFSILKDNSVDVHQDVRLKDKLVNLVKLPLKFNEVDGDFDISDNQLTSLEGCPKKVTGSFLAFKNEISSLKGAPKEVGGSFIVLQNNIGSLKFSPSIVKEDYICSHNPLKELDGLNVVLGHVFTGVYLPKVKNQKYVYNGVATYKYPGDFVMKYLEKKYVTLTDEEEAFEKTRNNIEKVITQMLNNGSITVDKVTDSLLNNLKKYRLDNLRERVLLIKYPTNIKKDNSLTEDEIKDNIFDVDL